MHSSRLSIRPCRAIGYRPARTVTPHSASERSKANRMHGHSNQKPKYSLNTLPDRKGYGKENVTSFSPPFFTTFNTLNQAEASIADCGGSSSHSSADEPMAIGFPILPVVMDTCLFTT